MTEVAAALIWKDDRFMICRRPETKARGLLWEFVGGKLEKGETGEEALVRECREELDIEVGVRDLFMDVIHHYPDIDIHLYVYNAYIVSGTPRLLEHADLKWIRPADTDAYDFCPADEGILEKIKESFR